MLISTRPTYHHGHPKVLASLARSVPTAACSLPLLFFFWSGICGAQIGAAAARCTVEACSVMELHMKVMKVQGWQHPGETGCVRSESQDLGGHKSSAVEGCFDFVRFYVVSRNLNESADIVEKYCSLYPYICISRMIYNTHRPWSLRETKIYPQKGTFEDCVPFHKVGYVSSLDMLLLMEEIQLTSWGW